MNKAESQQVACYLDSIGYQNATSFQEADLVVLNTCVVRQKAEDKVLGTLGLLKGLKRERPNLHILVTGCFVDSDIEGLQRRFPHVDFFFKPGAYSEMVSWAQGQGISAGEQESSRQPLTAFKTSVHCKETPKAHSSPCAFVCIIQGCDNFCSYCIVPYRRGREVSRLVEEIICEVEGLVKRGAKEVILLGQNVDSYGHDLPEHPDLADLLTKLNSIDGLVRIRFLTNYPRDMSLKLIQAVASLDKVCEHLELPVQAGDNGILKIMRRGYTVEQYRELIHTVRHHISEVALSTDIIVGFPGESEEQFENTFSLLKELRFDVVHVAAYSPRSGTIAWRKYEDTVLAEIKKTRLNKVEKLQESIASQINSQLQGKVVEVLVEGNKKGKWYGRTRNDKLVFFEDAADWLGLLARVKIDKTSPWALQGRVKQ